MNKVLILGAGMVAKPIVTYLLDNNYFVTVATMFKSQADAIIQNRRNSQSIEWTVDNIQLLEKMLFEHDIVVSLLPYKYHVKVAEVAIKCRTNMITASYVSEQMRALDKEAKKAGVIILNEMGLDPGIDHMSAKRIIDSVHSKGGMIEEFYSITGALPAPEVAVTNPFSYKFSWSPLGVLMAGNNNARYLRNGKEYTVNSEFLFRHRAYVFFPELSVFEVYPNRDSLPYKKLYSIEEAKTVYRGTFRYPGWSEIMDAMKRIGLLSEKQVDANSLTYRDLMAKLLEVKEHDDLSKVLSNSLDCLLILCLSVQ